MTKRSLMIIFSAVLFGILLGLPFCAMSVAAEIQSEELITIESRPKIEQSFILIKPENPVASIIVFAGGKGNLKLYSSFGNPVIGNMGGNFLVKTREQFAEQGLIVAVYDVPSDQKKSGMPTTWRMNEQHVEDIKGIVKYLKDQSDIPVWLVGTSRGTVSAVNAAVRLSDNIDGLVLTSSMTKFPKEWKVHKTHPNAILDMDLDKIEVPTLIVAHKGDKCWTTPPEDAEKIKPALVNSSKVDLVFFTGGKKAKSKDCWPKSPHGFYGLEDQVVKAISDFIKANY